MKLLRIALLCLSGLFVTVAISGADEKPTSENDNLSNEIEGCDENIEEDDTLAEFEKAANGNDVWEGEWKSDAWRIKLDMGPYRLSSTRGDRSEGIHTTQAVGNRKVSLKGFSVFAKVIEEDYSDEKTYLDTGSIPQKSIDAEELEDLAMKLANPVANLISLPFQFNYDRKYGLNDDGSISRLNIQPVIPFSLNEDWIVITRTIVPLRYQEDIPIKGKEASGLGDILASQFFSPKETTAGDWIWGVGPAWLLPTATDETLGGRKWAAGPTAVALKQTGSWTYGMLANHLLSFEGDDDRRNINATFVQPFVSYVTDTKSTITLQTESTFDWKKDEWLAPVALVVSQMFEIGNQPIQVSLGTRYWADAPDNGPEGWGFRLVVTLLFPK